MTPLLRTALSIACLSLCGFYSSSAHGDDTRATTAATRAPGPVANAQRQSFAVIIGNNKSLGRRRPELHYADDDAARYYEILQTMAPGRVSLLSEFDRDTARLFPDAQLQAVAPTRENLTTVGRRLVQAVGAANAAGQETEVYFIFAGHGDVAKGEGFIEMADERFRSSELSSWLSAIPFTRAHVILDSCNSFFMLGVRKPGGRHFATSEDAARALASRLPNVGVFLSTSADGEAFEWSEIQSGIFSHVVRSGLLGAADANADGQVSYVELAAFVDTATAEVQNPNMRPHVFARGPHAKDETPIARLHSMANVRRFELGDAGASRLRLRDSNGLPLLDAHTEQARRLVVALPETWARGSVVERLESFTRQAGGQQRRELFFVPDAPGTVTLAALQELTPGSAVRGPDDTFRTLFAKPFGPTALSQYVVARREEPPPVFGVSREDTLRMQLLLDQLSRFEHGRRMADSIGSIGFGVLLGAAGIGVLHLDSNLSSGERTEALVLGGALLGLGALTATGSIGPLFVESTGEKAAADFRQKVDAGGDTAQAFAAADKRIQELIAARRQERSAQAVVGGIVLLGCGTGLTWSELAADSSTGRMGPRLGWGAGLFAGALMLTDALFMDTPIDILAKVWRDDPSLNQYQPTLSLNMDGAFLSLSGTL